MRKIKINRIKTFVSSISKIYVYIANPEGSIIIFGNKYENTGCIKNGEHIDLEVGTDKIIIAFSYWKSENYNPAIYTIEEGSDDIILNVKATFGPLRGNPLVVTRVIDESK